MLPVNTHRILLCICISLTLLAACKHNEEASLLTPSQFMYTPDTAIVLKGVADTSVTPLINWNGYKGTFSFAATTQQGISIDNTTGKLSWTANIPIGTYLLPIIANNGAASADTIYYTLTVSGKITTIAGSLQAQQGFAGDGGLALNARFNRPSDVTVDPQGNIYIADTYNGRIRIITPDGIINTMAGIGQFNSAGGDGGPAIQAGLSGPSAVISDGQGNLYITDYGNNRIRKIDANGIISTVAGRDTAVVGYLGDEGPATKAQLYLLAGKVALDGQGSLYIPDYGNQRVRKVTPDGIIHTIAGNGTTGSPIPDGTPGPKADIASPSGVYFGADGNLYIVSELGSAIYKLNSAGNIYGIAGSANDYWGVMGHAGDGGPADKATLNRPSNIVADQQGNYYFTDFSNNKVRRIDTHGIISTIAGTGQPGLSGDGGPAAAAQLSMPYGLAIDPNGDLYIADTYNNRICKVTLH